MEKYGARGLMAIQLLGENHRHNPPMQVDLQQWAHTFEITTPVLGDPEWLYASYLWSRAPGEPSPFRVDNYALIDKGAVLMTRDKPSDDEIELALGR